MQIKNRGIRKPKVWERQIALANLVALLVGWLVWYIHAYISHKLPSELWGYSSFKLGFEVWGYVSRFFFAIGIGALTVATFSSSIVVVTRRKRLGYISVILGVILLFFSFGLSFISHKPGQDWWGYFYRLSFGTGLLASTFSTFFGTEQRQLRCILLSISLVLMLAGDVLVLMAVFN